MAANVCSRELSRFVRKERIASRIETEFSQDNFLLTRSLASRAHVKQERADVLLMSRFVPVPRIVPRIGIDFAETNFPLMPARESRAVISPSLARGSRSPPRNCGRISMRLRLVLDRRARQLGHAWLHDESVVEREPRVLHARRRRLLVLVTDVVRRAAACVTPNCTSVSMLRIVRQIDLRDVGLEARLVDQEVQMRRPHVVAALRLATDRRPAR